MGKKLTTDEFVARACKVHGSTYDYSKSRYAGALKPISIACRRHGPWRAEANSHLKGSGCPACARDKLSKREFVERATAAHGVKYDYKKTRFRSWKEEVVITCPTHGDFSQTPSAHLRQGRGCRKCGAESIRLGSEEFVRRAIAVHGHKYDYSGVVYKTIADKVFIVCRTHGKFSQTPSAHIHQKSGCPSCAGTTRLTISEFVQRAREAHGDRYNYDNTEYKNQATAVRIGCETHGEFFQLPGHHVRGFGCPWCSGQGRYTTRQWIAAARLIHGRRYDYTKAHYTNSKTPLTVICRKHGRFEQRPGSHLRGQGCARCSGNTRLTTREFTARAKAVHGDRYDYALARYETKSAPVTVICREHGPFEVNAGHHLRGVNCFSCAGTPRLTTKQFRERAREVFADHYDYSESEYVDSKTKVTIRCPTHGLWNQAPMSHLAGHGCPGCKAESAPGAYTVKGAKRGDYDSMRFSVYIVRLTSARERFFKIGLTTRSVAERNPSEGKYEWALLDLLEDLEAVAAIEFEQMHLIPTLVRESPYRPGRKFGGATECFRELPPNFSLAAEFRRASKPPRRHR